MTARIAEEKLLFQHLGCKLCYSGGATPKASSHSFGPWSVENIGVQDAPQRPFCPQSCSTKSQCPSDFVSVESGVPQGSVLGLGLFLMDINDLPNGLSSTVRLFADDTACNKTINKAADQHDLQGDLDKHAEWE